MVYAQVEIPKLFPPAKAIESPAGLINRILPNIFLLAGLIAFLLVVGGGFMMIQGASSGDSDQAGRGRKAVQYAIIGMVIIFGSYAFIKFLGPLFGVEIF